MADLLPEWGMFFVFPMFMLSPMLITSIICFFHHSYIIGGAFIFIYVTIMVALICCNMNACSEIGDQWWVPHRLRPTVPEGLFRFQIQALPKFKFERSIVHGSGGGGGWTQCIICLRVVKVGEKVRQLPKCGHLFHVKCIDKWLASHQTCPLCRQHLFIPSRPPV